jgi:hypothetical protein
VTPRNRAPPASPDRGFPADGVLAIGALDTAAIVTARLDLDALDAVRADGQVLGHRDWDAPAHLGTDVIRPVLR